MEQLPKDILLLILENLDVVSLKKFLLTDKKYYNTNVDNIIKYICQRNNPLYLIICSYTDNWRKILMNGEKALLIELEKYVNKWWDQHLSNSLSKHTQKVLNDEYKELDIKCVVIDNELVTFLLNWDYGNRRINWVYPFKNSDRLDKWVKYTKDQLKQQFKMSIDYDLDYDGGMQINSFILYI